jgi:putative endopeptidase
MEAKVKSRRVRLQALIALLLLVSGLFGPIASAESTKSLLLQDEPTNSFDGHGIDTRDMDLDADPGEDFYQFANGGWLENADVPSNFASFGVFEELNSNVANTLYEIILDLDPEAGSDEERLAELWDQTIDEDARDNAGADPLDPALDRIDDIHSIDDALNYHQDAIFDGVDGLLYLYAGFGFDDSQIYIPCLGGPTLSLPSSDYYLDDSDDMQLVREEWVKATANLLEFIGYDESDALEAADAVLELETAIAGAMTPEADRNDLQTYNNPRTVDELKALVPDLDWDALIASVGWTNVDSLLVDDIKFLEALPAILDEFSSQDFTDLYKVQLIWSAAPYLSEEIGDTAFEFNGPVLSGVEERGAIEDQALSLVAYNFPDTLGQLYVEEAFSPEAKAAIEELVGNLIDAFRIRIQNVTWMSEETKAKAIEKLEAMGIKVGYPDEWQTYEHITIEDTLYETINEINNVALDAGFADLGEPLDRTSWNTPVFEVNAYYSAVNNEIVFPAAILQPPFFDAEADPASNYGAIGFVIGHEITHGFDISGSQFDAQGNVNSWWTDADREAFEALNQQVIDQYSAIEVLPDLYIDGELTVTENVADLGGLQTAYDALQAALDELTPEEAARLPWFFTQEQRFYIAAATVWRGVDREEYVRLLIATDSHSPGEVRAAQPARNMPQFYEAFGIGPDDDEWLPPEERVVIW